MKNLILKPTVFIIAVFVVAAAWTLNAFAALQYEETYHSLEGTNKILVLVNSSIYDAIFDPSVKQYIGDLEAEDYNVRVVKFVSGSAAELKGYLKSLQGLQGAVLVGDLPVVYFYWADTYELFPTELFFRDLDGEFIDSNSDGYYDVYNYSAGNWIWISRLLASRVRNPAMDEAALLRNYFAKNHAYRMGKTNIIPRALFYPDDDWFDETTNLGLAYPDLTIIRDKAVTSAADYRLRLRENYEWISPKVHSSPQLHGFKINGVDGGSVYSADIRDIDPTASFYSLSACSAGRYSEDNYLAGNYVFTKTNGLLTIAATKACWGVSNYADQLGPDLRKTIGAADRIDSKNKVPGIEYGQVLLGDGTLSLDPPIASILAITPASTKAGEPATFNGSARIRTGSIAGYSWRSDLNGFLGDQQSFSTSSLITGNHTIYFKARDDKNRWSSEDKRTFLVGGYGLSGYIRDANNNGISGVSVSIGSRGSVATNAAGYYLDSTLINGTYIVTPKKKYYSFTPASRSATVNNSAIENVNFSGAIIPLAAPTNTAALAISSGEVQLSWQDNSSEEDGFKIERSADNMTFTQIAAVGINVTSYKDTAGLSGNKQYYYRIKAYNGLIESGYSSVVNVATLSIPAAPSNLTASQEFNNRITLNWNDNSADETGFKIERSTDNLTFTQVALAGQDSTRYYDGGLEDNKEYYYRVRAYNTFGNSGYSNIAQGFSQKAPAAPTNLAVKAMGDNAVVLTWQDNSDDETNFIIQKTDEDNRLSWLKYAVVPSNFTSFNDSGLIVGKTYSYIVYSARGEFVKSAPSNSAQITMVDATPITGEIKINNNAAWANLISVTLNLSALDGGTAMGAGAQMSFSNDGATWSTPEAYAATKTWNLAVGEGAKTVYAKFKDPAGNWSAVFSDTINFDSIPPVMSGCLIDNGALYTYKDEVKLTCAAQDSGSGVNNGIFVQLDNGALLRFSWFTDGIAPITNKTDGVKTYGFKAVDGAGNWSEVVTRTIIRDTTAPSGTIKINNDAVNTDLISVTLSLSVQETGSGMGAGALMSFSNDGVSWSDPEAYAQTKAWNLAAGDGTKTVYVKFKDAASNWSWAASDTIILQVKIPPVAPSGLTAALSSYGNVSLNWQDNSTDETGFKIEKSSNGGAFIQIATGAANAKSAYLAVNPGGVYSFRVRAYNAVGDSAYSNTVSATMPNLANAPSNLQVKLISQVKINLSWQDNSSEESGFMVYRSVNNGSYSQIAVVTKNVITLSDTAGLTPGSTYSYKVLAYNVAGLSGYSSAVAVTVPVVPSAPTNLSAVAVSSSKINLSWTDNSSNETGFFVERRISGGSFTRIATLGANVKTYSSINLKANTSYSYRIRAYNSSGNSSYSSVVYATTLK